MAEIIVVASPKGGVGKTFVASTLAICLSKLENHVLLVDTNLYASNVSLYLGMNHLPTTLNDVIKLNIPPAKAIYHFNDSLDIMPTATHAKVEEANFKVKFLSDLLFRLRNNYNFVIVDTEPGFGKNAKAAITVADKLFLVSTPDIPSLMTTHKLLLMVKNRNLNNVKLILNKVMKAYYELKKEEVEELMGVEVEMEVPFDKKVLKALSLRTELEQGKAFKRILKLAHRLTESAISIEDLTSNGEEWLKEREEKNKKRGFLFFRF